MTRKDKGEVTGFFDQLKAEDESYAKHSKKFAPLASFVIDYEFGMGIQKLTQADVAKRAKTTQSAISRFESMKHPPNYDLLVRVSQALGDQLFLSPFGSLSISLPYDLHDMARQLAEKTGQTVQELMQDYVRQGITRDSASSNEEKVARKDIVDIDSFASLAQSKDFAARGTRRH